MTSHRRIPADWIKHLDDDKKKQDFEGLLRNSSRTLHRLSDIIDDYITSLDTKAMSAKEYDGVNWPYKQADYNGMKRAYTKIKDLITFIDR